MKAKGLVLALVVLVSCLVLAVFLNTKDDRIIRAQDPGDPSVTEMPAGWQDLPPAEFVDAAEAMFAAETPATAEHQQAVVAHAWDTFLNDETFIASGDWPTVQTMLDVFAGRRGLLAGAGVSDEQIETNLQTLRGRIGERLAAQPEIVTGGVFDELKSLSGTLQKSGYSTIERAQLYADWMDANDWAALSLGDRADLFEGVGADQLTLGNMAARWTGSVTASASGAYTFELIRNYGRDPSIRVWIGGRLVLDSNTQSRAQAETFVSEPVEMSGAAPADIRIELINEAGETAYSDGTPSMALLWKSPPQQRQIVPSGALSPPDGFGQQGAKGLKGEYFDDTAFTQDKLVCTRLDATLEFVWTWGPVAASHPDHTKAVLDFCIAQMTDATFLAGIPEDERGRFLTNPLRRLTSRFPGLRSPAARGTWKKRSWWPRATTIASGLCRSWLPVLAQQAPWIDWTNCWVILATVSPSQIK